MTNSMDSDSDKIPRRVMLRRRTTGAVSFGDTADVCTETVDVDVQTMKSQYNKHVSLLIAGGIAGSVGKTVTAPLSRLTILFQVHSMVSTNHNERYSNSLRGAILKVLRNEGGLAFWKGNGTSVVHRFPYSAVNFLSYETVKGFIVSKNPSMENSPISRFLSGAIAGLIATTSCYPLDLIRTRLATQLDSNIRYRGISHAFHRIRAEEGLVGLYRGMTATLGVTVPNLAINFTVYETLKEKRSDFIQTDPNVQVNLTMLDTLGCGAIAGIVSSLITFPIDVVRRRLQICGIHTSNGTSTVRSSTALTIFQNLIKEQGIRGLYRGLLPELLKVVPMVGITFGSFETMKKTFILDND